MRVLIDTNILLDVLSNRPEFVDMSSKVWKLCETHRVQGFISALSIANIVYILRKELSAKKTMEVIEDLFTRHSIPIALTLRMRFRLHAQIVYWQII